MEMETAITPEVMRFPLPPSMLPQAAADGSPVGAIGGVGSNPLLKTSSNAQIETELAQKATALNLYQHIPPIMGLAAHVRKCWQAAKDGKIEIEELLFQCQRQRNGEYDPQDKALLEASGGTEIYMMLTSVKCRAIEGGIKDVMLPSGEKCWSIGSTPVPDMKQQVDKAIQDQLSYELQQAAPEMLAVLSQEALDKREFEIRQEIESELKTISTQIAGSQEKYIEDSFVEGGHEEAMDMFIKDFTTFPTAFVKGPIIRNRKHLTWGDAGNGQIGPIVKKLLKREYTRVSPFDIYPSPGAKNLDDGYVIERMRLRVRELLACAEVPGFKSEAVRAVCALYGNGGRNDWLWTDEERKRLENRPNEENDPEAIIETLEFNGYIQGSRLVEWGMSRDKIQNLEEEYACKLWLVDNYVIMARLNDHPLGHRGYHCASYEATNDSIWGKGPPQLMRDCAKACNGAARAIVNNMGIACLTGDTVVYRQEGKGCKKKRKHDRKLCEVTLDQLWEQKNKKNGGLKRNVIRSLNENSGDFYGNRIVDIFDNGTGKVYRLETAKGYTIKATLNHRFMSDDGGYRVLEQFSVGDMIAVNGSRLKPGNACMDCGAPLSKPTAIRCKSCAAKTSTWNMKQAEEAVLNRDASEITARGRKLVRDQLKPECEMCGRKEKLHIHHCDKDPRNCDPKNLQTLCGGCHAETHARMDSFGNPRLHEYVSYDKITSIEYVGEERVFDLQMTAPDHNFIANGFVSHNSGPQVEAQMDRLDPDEDPEEIYPWKVWKTRSDQNNNNKQAIFFYQPKLVVKELMMIFDKFYTQAGEQVGVPAYEHGSTDTKGAGETARGLSMLMNASSKIIKDAIRNIDKHVTIPLVENTWIHLVMFDKIPVAGDIKIVARASEYMVMYEQLQMLRREWLQITNNPVDMAIIGYAGRAEVHREVIKSLKLPTDGIIPSRQEIQQLLMAPQTAQGDDPEKKGGKAEGKGKKTPEPAVSGTKGAAPANRMLMQ